MKKAGTILMVLTTLTALTIAGCSSGDKQEDAAGKSKFPAIAFDNMDKSANPGDDFFLHVNGTWVKNTRIPSDYSDYGVFHELHDKNQKDLKQIFEDAAKNTKAKAGSDEQKLGDFYRSGMDSAKIEADGIKPLAGEFKMLDDIKTIQDVQAAGAKLHRLGAGPFFAFFASQDEKNSSMVIAQVYQGGLGLPDRDYYLSPDQRSKQIRDEYLKHIAKMFGLMGIEEATAAANAQTIMKIETELAKSSKTRVELRDPIANYNKMKTADLAKLTPNFNWIEYFKNIGIQDPGEMDVKQPGFIKTLDKMMKSVKPEEWRVYLKWHLLTSMASYLSSSFDKENFRFYGTVLTGAPEQKPRWKRVQGTVGGALGEIVGKIYVAKFFPEKAKKRMEELVNNLKASFRDRFQKLTWMGPETKTKAIDKLNKIEVKIGYPNKWRDYAKLEIKGDSYIGNVLKAAAFEFDYQMGKINKPVDRGEWHMYPHQVNAYYNPSSNEIVFPAAILQPPFFNLDADDAVNYGAIGVVIAHEMTHGFDDQGRLYDAAGNLTNWWTADDSTKFTNQVQVLVDQYSKFSIQLKDTTVFSNGELTLGENIADFGGFTLALNAFKMTKQGSNSDEKIDAYTGLQRFFLAYAQMWRQVIRDEELMKRVKEDVHSLGKFRVNGVVRNVPEFYTAFGIKEGNKLYLAEKDRAVIW